MKKLILMTAVCLSCSFSANAQSMGVGKNVFYLGAGAGSGFASGNLYVSGAGYSYNRTPTFIIGYERGISEAIPQSIIGIGPSASAWFASNTYRDNAGHGWDKHWSDFTVVAKGYYHHKFLVKDKFDVYGSAMLGLKFRSYSFTATDPYYEYAKDSYSSVYPVVGAGIGARYYVSKSFGFYAEVNEGFNVNFAQVGFAFKF
ncbi:MAG: hypothetical protein JST26_16105 [Bacteroidetes bacterium]|nr:hypothetical protein [Bacteroidota bacterium]